MAMRAAPYAKHLLQRVQTRGFVATTLTRRVQQTSKMSVNFVSSRSWAEAELQKQGEKLTPAPEEEEVLVTESLVSKPSPKVEKLIEEVLELNFVEINMFVNALMKRLGVTAADVAGGGGGGGARSTAQTEEAAPAAAEEPPKVKDIFDLKLGAVDAKAKIKVIKEVRAITGLGLKEAKELVEKAPVVIKNALKKEEADTFSKQLTEAGATVEIL